MDFVSNYYDKMFVIKELNHPIPNLNTCATK